MEELLAAGAQIDVGTPHDGGGDIVDVYAGAGGVGKEIRPVLALLLRYSTPAARQNALYWIRPGLKYARAQRRADLEWLIDRLEH